MVETMDTLCGKLLGGVEGGNLGGAHRKPSRTVRYSRNKNHVIGGEQVRSGISIAQVMRCPLITERQPQRREPKHKDRLSGWTEVHRKAGV